MGAVRSNALPWVVGTLTALIGVALARLAAPHLAGNQRLLATIGGQLLAFVGLFIICVGVRRRVKAAAAAKSSLPE